MLFQDILFFYAWLSNNNSQLRINYIGLVLMVPTSAHLVSLTMKIATTCSLNALILQRYGGMFVMECDIPRMRKSMDEWIRWWGTVIWNGKNFRNVSHKLGFTATMYCVWQEQNARILAGTFRKLNVVATSSIWWEIFRQLMKTLGSKELGRRITYNLKLMFGWFYCCL